MSGSRGYHHLLLTYLAPQWRRVLVLAVLLTGSIGLQLVTPRILRSFIDSAQGGAALGQLAQIALLFVGAALLLQATQLGETYVAENVGLTATNELRADLTLHVLRLDPGFHAAHTPGELIERTDGDVATLGAFFARLIVHLVGNTLLLVGALGLLLAIDWRIGLVVSIFAAVAVAILVGLGKVTVRREAALRQANAELFGLIEERLAGTEDVRANGGVGYVLYRLAQRSRDLVWAGVRARFAGGGTFHLASTCLRLGTVAALALAAYLYRGGELTIGTVYLVFAYTESLRRPIEAISRHIQELQRAAASIGRIGALLEQRSVVRDGPGAELAPGPLAVDFRNVTFAYDGGDPVLKDVSFGLAPGQVLGLLGRTGSGKTTVARLLFRLYDPDVGSIALAGTCLTQPTIAALRRRVGMVTQDIQLFHASVRDNVTLFDPAITDERVETVLDDVGLGAWLRAQPEGLAAMLAPGGIGLSAGEAQLLAFARVFLADPGLVVLDEASSRLDPTTERLLESAVDRLLRGRTAIVIAHRLATVQRADRILVLEDGCVVEHGDRDALAADPTSRFGRLLRVGVEGEGVLA